jgi:hypothetical protein
MYHRRTHVLVSLLKPVLVFLLLAGVFGLVWLRSSIISIEYAIGDMERQKAAAIVEAQLLSAELSALMSIREVDERKLALAFPDRQRVIYVKRDRGGGPYTASFTGE